MSDVGRALEMCSVLVNIISTICWPKNNDENVGHMCKNVRAAPAAARLSLLRLNKNKTLPNKNLLLTLVQFGIEEVEKRSGSGGAGHIEGLVVLRVASKAAPAPPPAPAPPSLAPAGGGFPGGGFFRWETRALQKKKVIPYNFII